MIDWDSQPLGQEYDTVIAARLGVSQNTVYYHRRKRGIPAWINRGRRLSVNWDSQPLGEMHDSHLAKRLGVAVGTVNTERRRRGIPKHNPATGRDAILMAAGLGVLPDIEVAEETGVNIYMVARMRRQMGFRPPRRKQ